MQAMIRTAPQQARQVSTSIPNTRFRRCAKYPTTSAFDTQSQSVSGVAPTRQNDCLRCNADRHGPGSIGRLRVGFAAHQNFCASTMARFLPFK